jgi:hypothetical protein
LGPSPRPGLTVGVANGDRITCTGLCAAVSLRIADQQFHVHLYVLPLGGYELVLGCQWLHALGPILWDFERLSMSFWRDDHRVLWFVLDAPHDDSVRAAAPDNLLLLLLAEFADLFAAPQGLPSPRQADHRIHLLPGAAPVAVRPYRYPQLCKDEIERQCEEMLQQGIIRPSTSPFSSQVLLVKKDETWRFCVDYRALNAQTVKDKFPIPVVDELLDELCGAHYFTNIGKTAFHTHHGHFEFLVMGFGLTNVPSTFQAMMNDVLRPFLRRFILVFFGDILIYNPSWTEHLQHVRAVFQQLHTHHLALKQSMCSFGAQEVAYLGQIINSSGVSMDPTKIDAVQSWPTPTTVRALRGFLGLTCYYRKFIQDYGTVALSLTQLLKREVFVWMPAADEVFSALKRAVTTGPTLQPSSSPSSSTAMPPAVASAPCYIRTPGQSRSTAGRWHPSTPSWRRTSAS